MTLSSTSFHDGQPLHPKFALGVTPGYDEAAVFNVSPNLSWSDVPPATRSFVVTAVDPDAPASREDVGVPGKKVAKDRPRTDFVHWVLYDIPADRRELGEGEDSVGQTPRGKDASAKAYGVRGQNDYTGWFAGDADLEGTYHGYDGPYPPPNDERVHRYVFTVYALDTDTLGLAPGASRRDVEAAMNGHVLEQASIHGTYTLNPEQIAVQ